MTRQEFTVHDVFAPVSFWGEIVADRRHDNAAGDGPTWKRWTDMVLYRILETNSRWRYAVHIVGRSVIYHAEKTSCRESRKTPWLRVGVEDLYKADKDRYEELIPCPEPGCRPGDLDDLPASRIIRVERDQHKLIKATSAKDIIRALYKEYGQISAIARDLLTEASLKDPLIMEAIKKPRRID